MKPGEVITRWERALRMTGDGYTLQKTPGLVEYTVQSPKGDMYRVWKGKSGWHCTCPDHQKHRGPCKHILWIAAARGEAVDLLVTAIASAAEKQLATSAAEA